MQVEFFFYISYDIFILLFKYRTGDVKEQPAQLQMRQGIGNDLLLEYTGISFRFRQVGDHAGAHKR